MPAPFCPPSFPVRHRLPRGGWRGGALAVLLLAGCGKQETKPEAAVKLAALWFNTRGQPPLEARYRPRLEEIRAQVSVPGEAFPIAAGFGPLAVGNTEHKSSRLMGGDLGWLDDAPGSDPWGNAVLEAAAALHQPGELSAVTATKEGLFLVRMTERRASSIQSFDEARPRLAQTLLEQRRRDVEEQFTRKILNAAPVQRFDDRLPALAPLPSAAVATPVRPELPAPKR